MSGRCHFQISGKPPLEELSGDSVAVEIMAAPAKEDALRDSFDALILAFGEDAVREAAREILELK